ncbi:MAG: hypothetical protein SGPRY_014368 [Prymnesium sp.]
MGNSNSASVSSWDDLFQALTRPNDLKRYLEENLPFEPARQSVFQTQIDLLAGTLQVDVSLLKVNEVAESFDTATFCLGQLVSHEPRLMSELPFAMTVVAGLSCALRKGWLVHHGVGKFAANALTILCVCETAVCEVRERAIDELLAGLMEWLHSEEGPQEVDEVCGCNCGCASLSATCWLERLLGKPDKMLEQKIRSLSTLPSLCKDVMRVVTRQDGNPFSLTRLLSVPDAFHVLLQADRQLGSDAFTFLTFGILQFRNPMFTEDAVQVRVLGQIGMKLCKPEYHHMLWPAIMYRQLVGEQFPTISVAFIAANSGLSKAIQALLRSSSHATTNKDSPHKDDVATAEGSLGFVLSHRASLPLFEALGTAACYLPIAMTALETLSASPVGRLAIYSLAAALSKRDPFSASTAPALSAASHGVTSAASSESAAEAITAEVADTVPILPGPGSPLPGSPDGKGPTNEANGLVTRVINEAGQLASKIRTIWVQSGNTSRSPAIPAVMGSAVEERGSSGHAQADIPFDSLNETQASARSAPGLLSAEQYRNSSKSEETDDEDSDEGHEHNCDGNDRNELEEPANEASLSLGEQEPESEANQIGVEAWDRFLRELPELTAVTLTELVEIPDCQTQSIAQLTRTEARRIAG